MDKIPKARLKLLRSGLLFFGVLVSFACGILLFHPESPLPNQWHPFKPLVVSEPKTMLTGWKFRRALQSTETCLSALDTATDYVLLEDKIESANCGIAPRITFDQIGLAGTGTLETTCRTALSLAMWETHGVQRRAEEHFQTSVTRIRQIGSYSCRAIRTTSGASNRWSTHSKALAIDVTGFDLANGQKIRLQSDWDSPSAESSFLKAVRDDACDWFGLTLSPDYNALHADHFHLQVEGWGGCR